MIIIDDIEQQSPEWFALKAGIPGASSFNKIVTSTGAPSKQRQDYLYQLAGEAITGKCEPTYQSAAMAMGNEREAESRVLYELIHGVDVKQVGFIFNGSKMYGCSPDGIITFIPTIGVSWGLELKNVIPKTQVKYLLAGKLPTDYFQQVQGGLLVTGFDRWDFFSYCPGMDPLIIQVERDEKFISKLETELEAFCFELAGLIKKLKGGP